MGVDTGDYLRAVEGVRQCRNALYEAYNQMFEAYAALDHQAINFMSCDGAVEEIRNELELMLADVVADKARLDFREIRKVFKVGRHLYEVVFEIEEDCVQGLYLYSILKHDVSVLNYQK